jgi:DNA-binding Lrp family transcriptional regulator
MDKIDKKLLKLLAKNARISVTQLAKRSRISREQANYRLKKLPVTFYPIIDYKQLGVEHFVVFMQNNDIKKIKNHPNINWIGTQLGKWGIVFDIYSKVEDLNKILRPIVKGEYAVLCVDHEEVYPGKLVDEEVYFPKKKEAKLDVTDKKILQFLNNARVSYTEIAKQTDLSVNTIKTRIKRMEKTVIQGYTIAIDHKAFNKKWFGLQVKIDLNNHKEFETFLRLNPLVTYFYRYTLSGHHHYDFNVLAKDEEELKSFISGLKADIINSFIVLDVLTSQQLPPAVFNQQ